MRPQILFTVELSQVMTAGLLHCYAPDNMEMLSVN